MTATPPGPTQRVTIKPQWSIRVGDDGAMLAPRVVELLVKIDEQGSLSSVCQAQGLSYRHAWELIRQGEAVFGEPLVRMERGKGSQLTALGEKLVWADRRINARLSPVLDTLASELDAEIEKVLSPARTMLRIHANHGFAVETLRPWLERSGVHSEFKYCGSIEAVAALNGGACDVAGFPVPIGEFEPAVVEHYRRWFAPGQRIVNVATRRQGLMVAPGNPLKIYELKDLARPGVRFINRQPGSGTRLLLDLLLRRDGIEPGRINGYEQCELTHAAVAAYVASGMADAGYGVETPARQFKLDFLPSQVERYFFLCHEASLASPPVMALVDVLRSPEYRAEVNRLAGYEADESGRVMTLDEAFETLRG
ncbi:MAG: helix-turn-helix transcriptional regulator [Proteobacteria bacterium]|nr:helix-turn-helix transcriptional regulator [Pseudomonadota bacterium]